MKVKQIENFINTCIKSIYWKAFWLFPCTCINLLLVKKHQNLFSLDWSMILATYLLSVVRNYHWIVTRIFIMLNKLPLMIFVIELYFVCFAELLKYTAEDYRVIILYLIHMHLYMLIIRRLKASKIILTVVIYRSFFQEFNWKSYDYLMLNWS